MKSLLNHLVLSPSQKSAVEAGESHALIIQGAPGSGKTRALLHRAACLADSLHSSPNDYRIFLPSAELAVMERKTLDDLGIPIASVMTFQQWCMDVWLGFGLGALPLLGSGVTDHAGVRAGILTHVEQVGLPAPLRYVMVDDGQDLDETSFKILARIATHLTVATHDGLQIVDGGLSMESICAHIGPVVRHELCGNFRNTKTIAKLAGQFGPRLESCGEEKTPNRRPMLATTHLVRNEIFMLARQLLANSLGKAVPGEPVPLSGSRAVLVPNEHAVEFVRKELSVYGLKPVTVAEAIATGEGSESAPFVVATFEEARGMTFDNVLMPTLEERFWQVYPAPVRKKMMFLGVTRATRWVYVSLLDGSRIEEHHLFQDAVGKEIMRGKKIREAPFGADGGV